MAARQSKARGNKSPVSPNTSTCSYMTDAEIKLIQITINTKKIIAAYQVQQGEVIVQIHTRSQIQSPRAIHVAIISPVVFKTIGLGLRLLSAHRSY